MRTYLRKVAWLGVWVGVFLLTCASEGSAEGISGVVKDQQGAVLPGVDITIENLETGVKRQLVTGPDGRYEATNLPPGSYAVHAALSGFATVVRRGMTLTVGRNIEINIDLPLGELSDEIVVVGEAPLVDTSSAAVSGLVDERAIRDLPLVSRSWDQLIKLHSGASTFRPIATGSASQGFGEKFTISGQRFTSNSFYQDGVELGGAQRITGLPGSAAGVNLGVEAIREFRVLTSSYSPEYGKKSGGSIITVTKSGTNELHGSLFYFHRNDSMDSANFFDQGEKDPFTRHNFGGSAGGPVVRNKTFFFANYEALREDLASPLSVIVPNALARQGVLPNASGQLVSVGVAAVMRPYLDLWPMPNGRDFGDGTAAYEFAPTRTVGEDYFLGRFDHNFSAASSIFSSYTISDADVFNPLANPLFFEQTGTREQRAAVEYKRILSPTMLNVTRFGFHRSFHRIDAGSDQDLPILELTPGAGLANITVTGLVNAGPGTQGQTYGIRNSFQVGDHISWVRDKHSLEFGGQMQRIQINEDPTDRKNGEWRFDSLSRFLEGRYRDFTGGFPPGSTGVLSIGLPIDIDYEKHWRLTYGAVYLRDRYRILDNLTLDLGLRYEVLGSPTEINGRVSNFPFRTNPPLNYIMETVPVIGKKAYPTHWGAGLAPRIGVAWDPFGKGKTVVQAGYGIFYDQIESEFRFFTHINAPFAPRAQTSAANAFPIPWNVVNVGSIQTVGRSIDPDIGVPRVSHFNAGIEQQVGDAASFRLTYVGSRGADLLGVSETNLAVATLVNGEPFWPAGARLANPLLGQWDLLSTSESSRYDALQTEFQTRFSGGGLLGRLRNKVAYAWSKSTDTMSGLQSSAGDNSRAKHLDPFNIERDRGLSSHHVAQVFSWNFTLDLGRLPLTGMTSALLNDWQVSGIWSLATGVPINIENGVRQARNSQNTNVERPNLIPGGNSNPVLGGYEQYFDPTQFVLPPAGSFGNLARNTLIGPALSTFDLSVSRTIRLSKLSEDLGIQVRLEFFNLFNQANFGLADRLLFNTNGTYRGSVGRISDTSTPGRQTQLGVKVLF